MKNFDIFFEGKSNKKDKYEFNFDGNIGYVINKDLGYIIIMTNNEKGIEFLKEATEKMNNNKDE